MGIVPDAIASAPVAFLFTDEEANRHEMKVLIVEDDRPMRKLIKRVIGDLAEAVYECADGSDALSAYRTNHPDWVLMDIRMKQTDGLEATAQILNEWPCARVLIVTSYSDASLREAARCAGACGYVLKEDLFQIRKWLVTPA